MPELKLSVSVASLRACRLTSNEALVELFRQCPEATAVLEVLAVRGIEVPDSARERITGCTDLDQLQTWVRRAVTVSAIEELFA